MTQLIQAALQMLSRTVFIDWVAKREVDRQRAERLTHPE